MPATETFRGVVYPWLTDQMGHLTVSRYVEMFDTACYHLFHALGMPFVGNEALGWADVRHEIDYRREAGAGALVLIRSGVLGHGRSSLRARHVMTDPDGGVVHAVMDSTTVRFDLLKRKSVPLPPDFADRAAPLTITDVPGAPA